MGIASIVLGVLALLAAMAGFIVSFGSFTGPGAFLGAFLSFAGPVLALVGIVLGGVAVSRARTDGGESGAAIGGLIVSIIAFFPAFFVALFCGTCSSLCAAAHIENMRNPQGPQPSTPWWLVDSGVAASPGLGPQPPPPPYPTYPPPPDPSVAPPDPSAPAPAFPPPPVGSGTEPPHHH